VKLKSLLASFVVGLSMAGVAASAAAREVKIGVGLPTSHPVYFGIDAFAKTLREKSNGELQPRLFPLALLGLTQMVAGVRDGVVDGGYVLPPLFTSDFPDTQLAVNLSMLGTNAYAMAGAMTEYNLTCPECLAERLKVNHVYLGSSSTETYWILSTKKISTLDELKGKKLRSGAAPWSRWAQHFGAVPVTMSANEVFEAVSQGTVDGTMVTPTELASLRLIDVVKHITTGVPGGTYHGQDIHNVNRNTWRSLTEAQRRLYLDAAATAVAATTWKFVTDNARNVRDAQQKGIQFHAASPEVVARSAAFVQADLAVVAQSAEKSFGIKNADQKVARFRQLVDKWEKLVPLNANWEPERLAEVYRREIFSKIDPRTYGM
jgi:TRAP-type transport system periplasmic protein